MRKNSTLKVAGSAKCLWQDYEYHCCMHKHNYVNMAIPGGKERFECCTLTLQNLQNRMFDCNMERLQHAGTSATIATLKSVMIEFLWYD